MKYRHLLLLVFLAGNVCAQTQDGSRRPPLPPSARPSASLPEGVKVPAWKELSPQQRDDLSEFADRWDRLPPWQRVRILERQQRWQSLPPERRQALHAGARNFQQMSPEQRQRMRRSLQRVRELSPERRQELQRQWRKKTPEQRRRWLEAGGPGVAPPPER